MPRWPSLVKTLEQRLMEKVQIQANGCWQWHGARNGSACGYGILKIAGKRIRAHRVSWELKHGLVQNGMHVLHRCDNPRCVNAAHLFLGTQADNMADMVSKGRQRSAAKLTWQSVRQIRAALSRGEPKKSLARHFGVTPTTIRCISKNLIWKEVERERT